MKTQLALWSSRRGGVMKSAIGLMVFLSAVGTLGWMLLMPSALRVQVESRTGFPVEVGSLASNPLGFSVSGSEIVIGNPTAFGGGEPMLQIKSLSASASLPALGRGEIWIDDLEIVIPKARIVADERGVISLDVFLKRLFASKEANGSMPFHAERIHFVVDEIEYVDLSAPVAAMRTVKPMLEQELTNVDSPEGLLGPLVELGRRLGALPAQTTESAVMGSGSI